MVRLGARSVQCLRVLQAPEGDDDCARVYGTPLRVRILSGLFRASLMSFHAYLL